MRRPRSKVRGQTEASLEEEIAHLRGLNLKVLRSRWQSVTGREAPSHLSRQLLFSMIAYRVQVDDLFSPSDRALAIVAVAWAFFAAGFTRAERWVHRWTAVLMGICLLSAAILYIGPLAVLVGRRGLVEQVHVIAGIALPIPIVLGWFSKAFRADAGRLNR